MKGLYKIGDIVRYGEEATAVMKVEQSGHNGRYYGKRCLGGYVGANHADLQPASDDDLSLWKRYNDTYEPFSNQTA